ncbi:Mrr restriction system protein [Eubacterium sp. AM28-29]|nr:Mrr restriction system protein [Eubacterium sp. AM28-29]
MYFNKLSGDEKIAYLIKPILKVLQDAGGQLERSDIKDKISELDDNIAEFAQYEKISKETGNPYKEFDWKFNFAIKDLSFFDIVTYSQNSSLITMTDKGLNIDLKQFDVNKEIIQPSKIKWKELSKTNKEKLDNSKIAESEEESVAEDKIADEFKDKLLKAIANMSPKKFESFSRALLTKMGVEFSNIGVQVSNDGGIDGYGYHIDQNDFRTTRVVIQCKRYNSGAVTEPEINQFLGAMNKYQADYGVYITNGRYTNAARNASREGSPITLIDGNDLVKLVIRYELYITPVKTYVLDDFYSSEN